MVQHGFDFATSAGAHRLEVESFPELVYGILARPCSGVNEAANIWVQNASKSLEEPPMRIDLFLVLLFKTEKHLYRCLAFLRLNDVVLDIKLHLCRVLAIISKMLASIGQIDIPRKDVL